MRAPTVARTPARTLAAALLAGSVPSVPAAAGPEPPSDLGASDRAMGEVVEAIRLMDQGHPEPAVDRLLHALDLDPTLDRAWYYVARCRLVLGDAPGALAAVDSYLGNPALLPGELADALYLRARSLLAAGRASEVEGVLAEYLSLPGPTPAERQNAEALRAEAARIAALGGGAPGGGPMSAEVFGPGARPDGPAVPPAPALAPSPPRRAHSGPALLAGGGAAAVSGALIAAVAWSDAARAESRYLAGGSQDPAEADDLRARADVLGPVGISVASVGTFLFALGVPVALRERAAPRGARVDVLPGSLVVSGSF